MPFDPMPRETALDRRRRLISALYQEMPEDFTWNFRKFLDRNMCGSTGCACGLAVHLGISRSTNIAVMATSLGLSITQANRLFYPTSNFACLWQYGVWSMDSVTPQMVARALEKCGQ